MLRVLVTGGREFADAKFVGAVLDAVHRKRGISVLIQGEATGADTLAKEWAEARGVEVLPFPANWSDLSQPGARIKRNRRGEYYDANAGKRRNRQMLEVGKPTAVVAFPGGPGTKNMCDQAEAAGLKPWAPRYR